MSSCDIQEIGQQLISNVLVYQSLVQIDVSLTLKQDAWKRKKDKLKDRLSELDFMNIDIILSALERAQDVIKPDRRKFERTITKLAMQLPVYEWIAHIRGVGALSLGLIIGNTNTGDLNFYRNPSSLWKRMGLAVIDGERQRRISSVGKIGESKITATALAVRHGYSATRRAVMHVVGESLLKLNFNEDGSDGYFRRVYLERKAYEMAKQPDLWKKVWHKRALRFMEKRFLRELWEAWRNPQEAVKRYSAMTVTS